jgi:hypothetical protein
VLIVVAIVLVIAGLFAADRVVKVTKRSRRRAEVGRRLRAVTVAADDRNRKRKAAAEVSGALTSIMPAIGDLETRHVE